MPRYRYTYLDHRERKKQGVIEALHLQEARENLAQQGIALLMIREVAPKRVILKNTEKILFTKQLILLMKSGLPLYESIHALRDQHQGQALATLLTAFMDRLRAGGTLSQAMASYPHIFDDFYLSGVIAGEDVGNLESCLTNIVRVLEEREQLSKKLYAALSYPLVLVAFSCCIVLFFLMSVIPNLRETFEEVELNRITVWVFAVSDFICKHTLALSVSLVTTVIGLFVTSRYSFWKRTVEKVLFSVPGMKAFFVKLGFGRFCSVASVILQGGGNLVEALQIGCGSVVYPILRKDLQEIIQAVIGGACLSKELSSRPWVPKLVLGMVALGEESGELGSVLGDIAKIYHEDTQKTLASLTTWCQPVILVLLGGVIGLIMLAILIPLTSGIQV